MGVGATAGRPYHAWIKGYNFSRIENKIISKQF